MGRSRVHWLCFPFLRVARGVLRSPLSTRTLILATLCGVYLLFLASCVGHSQQHRDGSTDAHRHRQSRGLEPQTGAGSAAVPTRSNVVYITLRFKRLKPANLRATVRPKLRRKVRQENRVASAFTRSAVGTLAQDARRVRRDFAARTEAWREAGDVDYNIQSPDKDEVSHIRMYSQRSPQWLSGHDVAAMRFLADARVWRVREVFAHEDSAPLVMFEGDSRGAGTRTNNTGGRDVCAGQCGVIGSPVDTAEVFAFHLDRVLGLNRTLPAVSRSFRVLHDGQPCSVVLWDASLYPGGLAAGRPAVRLTWGGYQRSLKQRCWHKNISPKPDSGCSTIHHYEWSKLALFDFLLQIHSRLDPSCCGFRPRLEDACVGAGRRGDCGDPDHIRLANIVRRGHDPRRLVFTNNKGFFDRNEDNLDFRLLDGIPELPEQAVSVLRSRRLREKLLQSLFLDRTYWESQGGRQGIDKLIDVIERRAKVLLTYINAHGIKVVPMHV